MTTEFTGVAATDVPILVNGCLPHYLNGREFETVLDYQNYYFIDELFDRLRMKVGGGNAIEHRYILDDNGSFRHTAMVEQRGRYDHLTSVLVALEQWKHFDFYATWEERTMTMMSDKSALLDYTKSQFFQAFASACNGLELGAAGRPEDSDDSTSPWGFPMWIRGVPSGTTDYVGGFNGSTAYYDDGTATTTINNVNLSNYSKLHNWAANHTGFNADLFDRIIRGRVMSNYVPPKQPYMPKRRRGERVILWPMEYEAQYQMLLNRWFADGRNTDAAPYIATAARKLQGSRTVGLATLNDDALEHVFDINMGNFQAMVLGKWWMHKNPAEKVPGFSTLWKTDILGSYGYIASNLRTVGAAYHLPRT